MSTSLSLYWVKALQSKELGNPQPSLSVSRGRFNDLMAVGSLVSYIVT